MPLAISRIFTELGDYIRAQYPGATDVRMPYCRLWTDPVSRETKYRAEVHYRKKRGDWLEVSAIAELDPGDGSILSFKEGYHYTSWV